MRLRLDPLGTFMAAVYMAAVVQLSSLPGRTIASWGWPPEWLDWIHVPIFAGMALVTLWAVSGPPRPIRAALVITACSIFAVSDEWHQGSVPGRISSLSDLRHDALGIAIGVSIGLAVSALGGIRRGVAGR